MELLNKEYSYHDLRRYFGSLEQIAGIRNYKFESGRAKNLSIAEFRSGNGLRFEVLKDRGLDIGLCEYKGIPISFRSSVGESMPYFFEPEGDEWFRNFSGGLLTTCGLTYLGAPSKEKDENLGLHGRISNIPAEEVFTFKERKDNDYVLKLKGKVREAKVTSTNLVLSREISLDVGSNIIKINDKITNEGFKKSPLMILYHINAGHPLLSKETKLFSDSINIKPRDDIAKKYINNYSNYEDPLQDYPDVVFYHNLKANENGYCEVELVNKQIKLALNLKYKKKNLPNFVQWKYLQEGTYVTALEPSNCKVEGRKNARENNELEFIEPGETKNYSLEISIIDNMKSRKGV